MIPTVRDLTGKSFNYLKVVGFIRKSDKRELIWQCECRCGVNCEATSTQLTKGGKKSCGCMKHPPRVHAPNWSGYGEIAGKYWSVIKANASKRNYKFTITPQQAWELFLKQERRCAISGVSLEFASTVRSSDGTASLDRIDSNIGYEISNIQWVHKMINRMKSDFDQDHFIEMCRKVTEHHGS